MKRKSIFLTIGIAVAVMTITVAGINYTLVSTAKNNSSTLTLERIQAYTGEGENSVKCCIGTTLSDITGVGNKCETTDYHGEFLEIKNLCFFRFLTNQQPMQASSGKL
jgi:hypothetical protein